MWKFKRSVGRFPVPRFWSPEDMKIVGWCLSNNISISCTVDWKNNIDKWFIDIKINNKIFFILASLLFFYIDFKII